MTHPPTANIGALQFDLAGIAAAEFPTGEAISRFKSADLEVEVRIEGDQPFLVIDHRLRPGPGEPARIEFWRCTSEGEAVRPYLLVVADRPPSNESVKTSPATTLSALLQGLAAG